MYRVPMASKAFLVIIFLPILSPDGTWAILKENKGPAEAGTDVSTRPKCRAQKQMNACSLIVKSKEF